MLWDRGTFWNASRLLARGDVVKSPVIAIAALVVIVGSAVWMFSYEKTQPEPGAPVLHKAAVACTACGKAYITMLGKEPAKCYYCGKQTVWHALQCAKCGTIVPVEGKQMVGAKQELTCPKCGGHAFKPVSPDGLEEH